MTLLFTFLFLTEFFILFRTEFFSINNLSSNSLIFLFDVLNVSTSATNFSVFLNLQNNLKTVAIALFSDYLFVFLVACFVLLLAMVAAIILTIQKSFITKSQDIYKQIMSSYNNSIVAYY
jgi:hypothetical protein